MSLPKRLFGRKRQEATFSPDFLDALKQLAEAEKRFSTSRDLRALDDGAAAHRRILAHPEFGSAAQETQVSIAYLGGNVYTHRYQTVRRMEDLISALQCWESVAIGAPEGSPSLPIALGNLGMLLRERYTRMGEAADLVRAVDAIERAISLTPEDSAQLPAYLANLGAVLRERYQRTGDVVDLTRSIEASEHAVATSTEGSYYWLGAMNGLGNAYRYRYSDTSELSDLDRAIDAHQQVVAHSPEGSYQWLVALGNLANELADRFDSLGHPADLDQAIGAYQDIVAKTPAGSPDLPSRLSDLGAALKVRYAHTGNPADLEQAINMHEQALTVTSERDPRLPYHLNRLGVGLKARYDRRGALSDLTQAIEVYQQALALASAGAPESSMYLNNLGNAWRARYTRTRELDHLLQAIDAYERAVDLTPDHSIHYPGYLLNLGTGLKDLHLHTSELAHLDRAIDAYQKVVARTPESSPHLPLFLNNLAEGLLIRYARTEMPTDLTRAIDAAERAVAQGAEGSPVLATCYGHLGAGLRQRYARQGSPDDLDRAVASFEAAVQIGRDVALEPALRSARMWGDWAAERGEWAEAVRAYDHALEVSDQLFRAQLLRASKAAWLREAQGLHGGAAYALAKCRNVVRAVEVMEQGRARLLGQVLDRDRADLARLEALAPDVFRRYQGVARQLRVLEAQEIGGPGIDAAGQSLAGAVRTARAELDAVVDAIRQVPGYEAFLELPAISQIQAAARPGNPVVYLTVGPHGALALVVTAQPDGGFQPGEGPGAGVPSQGSGAGVYAVWAELTREELIGLLVQVEGEAVSGYLPAQFGEASLHTALMEALPLLGARLVAPLAAQLRQIPAQGLVLIPGGLLGLLPLHAARYDLNGDHGCLLDEFDVSYAPSARVLASARRVLPDREGAAPVLAGVGNPLENPRPLRYARPELEEVATLFAPGQQRTLYERDATKDALLSALPGANYVHLSCHGLFNPDEPLDSHLLLADQVPFTVRELLASELLGDARLAVLAACQTAIADFDELPDEAIGLPTGFLQAGVPGVIGTLWPVNDLSTMLLMVKFYTYHLRGDDAAGARPMRPAKALRQAQLWLRELTNAELSALFAGYKRSAPDAPTGSRMPYGMAQREFRRYTLDDPDARPFARPFYWAPFVFNGV